MTPAQFLSLLGGEGLFLFGMTIMSTGIKNSCGDKLQSILEKATANKYVAVFVGLALTMIIQSSSATDVMVIGFVNSGLMSLAQATSLAWRNARRFSVPTIILMMLALSKIFL